MAKKQETKVVTRAEKKDATKNVIKELLAVKPLKHNELIEETAKIYTARFGGEDTENVNDVKGRVGSVIDIMKKDSEIMYDGGMYALKSRLPAPPVEEKVKEETEKPAKKTRAKAKKESEPAIEKAEEKVEKAKKTTKKVVVTKLTPPTTIEDEQIKKLKLEPPVEVKEEREKPVKKTKTTKAKKEKAEPLPPAPLQPNAPVAPITPEIAPEPVPEKTEEKEETPQKPTKKVTAKTEKTPAKEKPKKAAAKRTEKVEKQPIGTPMVALNEEKPPVEEKSEPRVKEEKIEVKNPPAVKEKGEIAKKTEVIDMSFLFGAKPTAPTAKPTQKTEVKADEKTEKAMPKVEKTEAKAEEKSAPAPALTNEPVKEEKPALKVVKTDEKRVKKVVQTIRKAEKKPQTPDERLKEAFLRRLRSLGGDYFEYYSVYLLERYSMKNGRRLEGLRISGGDRDGGIDGEIELTDKFGFRETIYIQSKNWNPDKGDERLWVVGETLLQQFIGACACRQAQDRKQHCRGIFITTSRFTPDAKRILETMSDKIVGYDGEDVYEAAKECQFGLVYENGNWKLDEKLLSGEKVFFNML